MEDEIMFMVIPRSSELKEKQWSTVAGNELLLYKTHNQTIGHFYIRCISVGYPKINIGVYS